MNILTISKPYIRELMKSVNEVIHLVIREGNEIVYVDKVDADNTIRMASTIGMRNPLYCTSVGKAILAQLDEDEVKEVWNNSKIKKLTEHTITDFNDMEEELKIVKKQGYAVDNEENEMGVRCIGAPIFNIHGEVEGAISISGPAIRVTEGKVEELAGEVVKYAELISQELGYIG